MHEFIQEIFWMNLKCSNSPLKKFSIDLEKSIEIFFLINDDKILNWLEYTYFL